MRGAARTVDYVAHPTSAQVSTMAEERATSTQPGGGMSCGGSAFNKPRSNVMRKILVVTLIAGGLGLACTSVASAAPVAGTAAREAADLLNSVEQVQHWRYGSRGGHWRYGSRGGHW